MNKKNLVIGLAVVGSLVGGGFDALNVSQAEFDQMIPTLVQAKDRQGRVYDKIVKDLSSQGLSQKETYFAQAIVDGKGITADGTDSVEEIQQLYFSTAVKMGLTAKDAVNGEVNLYEFIRK